MARSFDFSAFSQPLRATQTEIRTFVADYLTGGPTFQRVTTLESAFRQRFAQINARVPAIDGKSTNPFVLASYAQRFGSDDLEKIDAVIAAAKVFSSFETAAGRVVEDVIPPFYGWSQIASTGHSVLSEIDSAKPDPAGNVVHLAALKSGPMCINDSMVSQIASAIALHWKAWADHWGVKSVRYIVGMNYSTAKNSNKKDWHIVRLAEEKVVLAGAHLLSSCTSNVAGRLRASSAFEASEGEYRLRVETLQGRAFWEAVGGSPSAFLEISLALANCLGANDDGFEGNPQFTTLGIPGIVSFANSLVVPNFPVGKAQWFVLMIRHFVDELTLI